MAFVSCAEIIDMYVGETEKNLGRQFQEAASRDAVLLFDEADALFGKRGDITRATERHFNAEVNHALVELERFKGICILTTNHIDLLDPAVMRRLRGKVYFGPPEAETRAVIWRQHVPEAAPVAADVDYGKLGRDYSLTGGQIANAVMTAAAMAAGRLSGGAKRTSITMDDLRAGAKQESEALTQTQVGRRRIGFG